MAIRHLDLVSTYDPRDRPQRPTGVTVIAIYHLLLGVVSLPSALALLMASADASRSGVPGVSELAKYFVPAALVSCAIGAAYLASAWGLYRLETWGRTTAITLSGLTVGVLALVMFFVAAVPGSSAFMAFPIAISATYAVLAVAVIAYLMQEEVKLVFERGRRRRRLPPGGAACDNCHELGIFPGLGYCLACGAPAPGTSPDSGGTVIFPPSRPVLGFLTVLEGPERGQHYELNGTTRIGRDDDSEIRLTDRAVSRAHARLELEGAQFWIRDTGSAAGTYVQDQRCDRRRLLFDGNQIRLGNTRLVFHRTPLRGRP